MSNIEDKLWEHLVEHHEADRARLRSVTMSGTHRRRSVVVGIAATGLAAAAVATVVATSSGPGSTAANGSSAGSSALSAPTGAVKGEDTAYVVKRVRANIAAENQSSIVIHTELYASGDVNSDGSLTLGPQNGEGWDYDAPDGTFYQRNVGVNADGSPSPTAVTGIGVTGRVVNGKQDVTLTVINPTNHTYSRQVTVYSVPANASAASSPAVGLQSSPSEVQHALQSGQVTQEGTTTVDGTQAIALSVAAPQSLRFTVYVDAHSYQPLRTVTLSTDPANPAAYVSDWIPATPDNIAQAKDDSVPAGYTKVDPVAG
jgi:hypothetical protein